MRYFLLGTAVGAFVATLLLLISFVRYGWPAPGTKLNISTEQPFEIPWDPNMAEWEFRSTSSDETGQLVN